MQESTEIADSNIDELVKKQIELQSHIKDEFLPNNLIELNLHNIGLTSLDIEPLENLKSLKKLIVSFNKLKRIKEISNMVKIEYLFLFKRFKKAKKIFIKRLP